MNSFLSGYGKGPGLPDDAVRGGTVSTSRRMGGTPRPPGRRTAGARWARASAGTPTAPSVTRAGPGRRSSSTGSTRRLSVYHFETRQTPAPTYVDDREGCPRRAGRVRPGPPTWPASLPRPTARARRPCSDAQPPLSSPIVWTRAQGLVHVLGTRGAPMNQPVGHMVRISTNEKPRRSSCASSALRTIFFVGGGTGAVHRPARDVGDTVELREEVGNPDREAVVRRVANRRACSSGCVDRARSWPSRGRRFPRTHRCSAGSRAH